MSINSQSTTGIVINDPHELLNLLKTPRSIERDGNLIQAIDLRGLDINCELNLYELLVGQTELLGFRLEGGWIRLPYTICMDNTRFRKGFSAAQCKFTQQAIFNNTEFMGGADFNSSVFEKKASFYSVKFGSEANFDNVQFQKEVFFDSAIFGDMTSFKNVQFSDASFHGTKYRNETSFDNSHFSGQKTLFLYSEFGNQTSFRNVRFRDGKTSFDSAIFGNNSYFINTEFEGETSFKSVKFGDRFSFDGSTFYNVVSFIKAQFGDRTSFKRSLFKGKALFNHLQSAKKTYLSFTELPMFPETRLDFEFERLQSVPSNQNLEIIFEDLRLEDEVTHIYLAILDEFVPWRVTFRNCQLHPGNVQLTEVDMENHFRVEGAYGWRGFRFTSSCTFPVVSIPWPLWACLHALPDEIEPLNAFQTDAHARTAEYAMLKTIAKEQGDSQLASEFYAWQMWWSLKDNPCQPWKWLYCITSLFGLSVALPLFCLLILFLIFYGIHSWIVVGYPFNKLNDLISIRLLLLTFSGMNPFGYSTDLNSVGLENSDWRTIAITLIFLIQHISALYLYFQIGAAIRSRVKL